jgi:dTDP-4-dehydrorhamnose 3,5-epimerase
MIFKETNLKGAFIIEMEKREDSRGFYARTWCQKEFEAQGLVPLLVQSNLMFNKGKGTLRGMHYQAEPHAETKLFRCCRGAIYDVIIDVRMGSPTYKNWLAVELSEDNYRMLYVPRGFAQGYLTLQDNSEVTYQVSEFYAPGSERGIRYDDAAFGIEWPIAIQTISDKDKRWPPYVE